MNGPLLRQQNRLNGLDNGLDLKVSPTPHAKQGRLTSLTNTQ